MTPTPPTPATLTRTRVKWENLMIGLIAIAVTSFAVVGVIAAGSSSPDPAATAQEEPPAAQTTLPTTVPGANSGLTLDDAVGLVEEARLLMGEARWDEAAERLDTIPDELFAEAGATTLALELEATRSRYEQLRAQFDAAVEARQWKDAAGLFEQLGAIATADDKLLASYALVEAGLKPVPTPTAATAAAPAEDVTRPQATSAGTSAGGGATGGASSTTPTKPRPAAATTPQKPSGQSQGTAARPAAQQPAAPQATPTNESNASPSVNPLGPIELSPEAEAELNAALGFAAGELQ